MKGLPVTSEACKGKKHFLWLENVPESSEEREFCKKRKTFARCFNFLLLPLLNGINTLILRT